MSLEYKGQAVCRNCGTLVIAFLPKGTPQDGHTTDCLNCGCAVTFKAYLKEAGNEG